MVFKISLALVRVEVAQQLQNQAVNLPTPSLNPRQKAVAAQGYLIQEVNYQHKNPHLFGVFADDCVAFVQMYM